MEILSKKWVLSVILLSVLAFAGSAAGGQDSEQEGTPLTIEEKIKIAKMITEIKKLNPKEDQLKMKSFLDSDCRLIRKIVAWKIMFSQDKALLEYLQEKQEDDLKLIARVGVMLTERKNKTPEEFRKKILDFLENNAAGLVHESVYILTNEGWIKYLSDNKKNYPTLNRIVEHHPEITYTKTKEKTKKLPPEKKKKLLISTLTGWKTVFECEAAIRLLSEMGNKIIPDVLRLLDNPKNIPGKEAPPFERVHSNYAVILTLLKTVPDNSSITKLKELAESNNRYVSDMAKETLRWVESGVPYFYEYNRIAVALSSCERIPPAKKNPGRIDKKREGNEEKEKKEQAAEETGETAGKIDQESILKKITDKKLKKAVKRLLSKGDKTEALKKAKIYISKSTWREQLVAVVVISELGSKEDIKELAKLFDSKFEVVREETAQALRKAGYRIKTLDAGEKKYELEN
ncbi:MAG: hypothetical protein E3J72_04325 [Planctomycetota bacterium]|nr:MAG: hypothetical protein E3J72_04325 [Planctomycetota bacterium]